MANEYSKSNLTTDIYYAPFSRYIDVYGLRVFSTDSVTNAFVDNVASTYEAFFKDGALIDTAVQDAFISSLQDNKSFQRVGVRSVDFVGGEPLQAPIKGGYDESSTDYVWENPTATIGNEINEVIEHLLHTITTIGFGYFYPDWDYSSTDSAISNAMQQAVDRGFYDISSYDELLDDQEGHQKVTVQEFAYWLILAEWDYYDITDKAGSDNTEFTLRTANDIAVNLPLAHQLYLDTVAKIMSAPDKELITSIYSAEDLNQDIALDNFTVIEGVSGTHIANISGEGHSTYALTEGFDASSFQIVNDMLHLASGVSVDYESQSSYRVTLMTTGSDGEVYNEDFVISVTDVAETSDDTSEGLQGNDVIYGGDGLDTVNYSVASDAVLFDENAEGQLEVESANLREALVSVERLHFTDKGYALDLDGNAGIAAKAIIATFGADSLGSYMSAALSVVDGGTTLDGLCDLVVDLSLIENEISSSTNGSFVDHVYENVVGIAPSSADHDTYTDYLDNGTHTKSSLLVFAANTTRTEALVTANSIDLIGISGSADGEILAIQYDLGLG